jgi:hypothetical protein
MAETGHHSNLPTWRRMTSYEVIVQAEGFEEEMLTPTMVDDGHHLSPPRWKWMLLQMPPTELIVPHVVSASWNQVLLRILKVAHMCGRGGVKTFCLLLRLVSGTTLKNY